MTSLSLRSNLPRTRTRYTPVGIGQDIIIQGVGWVMGRLTPVLMGPVDEDVHGAHLGELVVWPVQPEDLLTALLLGFFAVGLQWPHNF